MANNQMTVMQKAKARMLMKHVFFATLVMSTRIEPSEDGPTAWTDMKRIWYNPKFVETLDDIELVIFVLAHEVMHIALKHGLRKGHRNHRRWNIACDFAINWMLKKAGFKIWDRCYCDPKYDGMSAEDIYEQREKDRQEGGGAGKPRRGYLGEGQLDQGTDDEDGLGDDLDEGEPMDAETRARVEQAITQKVAQAASVARMAGKLAGDLERMVDGVLNPPLSWQELLRNYMVKSAPQDESWNRRNRRFQSIYLPSKHSEAMGELVIIGDTSGSMDGPMFAQVGAEISEIMEFVKPERVRVIWADDTECAFEEVFEPGDAIVLHPKGGGGTDLRKPLAYVEKFEPIVVVLITDCYTPWPDVAPPYPLITVSTTNSECPHGATIHFNHAR